MAESQLPDGELPADPENTQIVHEMLDARERGDRAEFRRLLSTLDIPAEVLVGTKRAFGADWIREHQLRTERAEALYGSDWLDQQD